MRRVKGGAQHLIQPSLLDAISRSVKCTWIAKAQPGRKRVVCLIPQGFQRVAHLQMTLWT